MKKAALSLLTDISLAFLMASLLPSPAHAREESDEKRSVALWYDAFTKKEPALLDRILADTWVDIPSPPGTPAGPRAAKDTLVRLTTSFPDFKIVIEDVIQEGNKVVVRSHITATQTEAFMGFPATGRSLSIQAVDIHEFANGKIVRTWHTEDWMTGLRQLGVLDDK